MAMLKRAADALTPSKDAITLLKEDHKAVDALLKEFELAKGARQAALAEEICQALTVHATIEEEIFYPAARKVLDKNDKELVNEADIEHASIKSLVANIERARHTEPHFAAKMKVLGEYVKHHVKEEENELFPKLERSGMDLDAVGAKLAERKLELESETA
jgi:hemerythrin superfamily protein